MKKQKKKDILLTPVNLETGLTKEEVANRRQPIKDLQKPLNALSLVIL